MTSHCTHAHELANVLKDRAARHIRRQKHKVTGAYVFPLGQDDGFRAVYHELPEESPEGLGCVELRAYGCSIEVFYQPSGSEPGRILENFPRVFEAQPLRAARVDSLLRTTRAQLRASYFKLPSVGEVRGGSCEKAPRAKSLI